MAELLLLGLVLIAIFIALGVVHERAVWNNGVCAKNGLAWTYFDTDSQGGRGYRAGEETCWIASGVDHV